MLKREKLFAAIVLAGASIVGCTSSGLDIPDGSVDANSDSGLSQDATSAYDFSRDLNLNCDAYIANWGPRLDSCDMATQGGCICNECGCFEFPIIL